MSLAYRRGAGPGGSPWQGSRRFVAAENTQARFEGRLARAQASREVWPRSSSFLVDYGSRANASDAYAQAYAHAYALGGSSTGGGGGTSWAYASLGGGSGVGDGGVGGGDAGGGCLGCDVSTARG